MPPETTYNIIGNTPKENKTDIRINIPQENINKFKQVLLYILNKVGAKTECRANGNLQASLLHRF